MEDIANPFLDASPPPPPQRENETPAERLQRLQAREAELLQRQDDLRAARASAAHAPNWPKWAPVLYVNIDDDIPGAARSAVRGALAGVVLAAAQAALNIVASASVRGLPKYSLPRTIVFAIVFGVLSLYLTASVNFQRLYRACKAHDIPFSYTLLQFALILFLMYLFVGFPNSGSAGLATFLDLLAKSDSTWAKISAFVNTAALLADILLQLYVLQQAQKYQKVSGVEPVLVT